MSIMSIMSCHHIRSCKTPRQKRQLLFLRNDVNLESRMSRLRRLIPCSLDSSWSTLPRLLLQYATLCPPPLPSKVFRRSTSSRSSSSSLWLARQQSDPYVRNRSNSLSPNSSSSPPSSSAVIDSFVSRSAFKLLDLHSSAHNVLVRRGMNIVDLGAAPGGWIQAVDKIWREQKHHLGGKKLKYGHTLDGMDSPLSPGKIVGVDLLKLHASVKSLPGVQFVQGNFLDPMIQGRVMELFEDDDIYDGGREEDNGRQRRRREKREGRIDLVLSDMMANLTGSVTRDAQLSIDLSEAALEFALKNLTPSRSSSHSSVDEGRPKRSKTDSPRLVIKQLQSSLSPGFQIKLRQSFKTFKWEKPPSSRVESREGYWICSGLIQRKNSEIEETTEVE